MGQGLEHPTIPQTFMLAPKTHPAADKNVLFEILRIRHMLTECKTKRAQATKTFAN